MVERKWVAGYTSGCSIHSIAHEVLHNARAEAIRAKTLHQSKTRAPAEALAECNSRVHQAAVV